MRPVNPTRNSRQILVTEAGEISETQRIDDFLGAWITAKTGVALSKSITRKLISVGAVEINRRIPRGPAALIGPKDTVRVEIESVVLAQATERQKTGASTFDFPILYQDGWIIVVSKPVGLPTQPTLDPSRPNLFDLLKKKLGAEYLGLHHRLDRDTSGAILFTLKKEANVGVAALFKERRIHKIYSAITLPPLPTRPLKADHWVRKDFLKRDPRDRKMNRMISVRAGGDFAETEFQVLRKSAQGFLIEAKPKTGRMHQIRVHLSEEGVPILGDTLYGAPPGSAPRVMLHAHRLSFSHPIHGKPLEIEVPPPADFERVLKEIQGKNTPPDA